MAHALTVMFLSHQSFLYTNVLRKHESFSALSDILTVTAQHYLRWNECYTYTLVFWLWNHLYTDIEKKSTNLFCLLQTKRKRKWEIYGAALPTKICIFKVFGYAFKKCKKFRYYYIRYQIYDYSQIRGYFTLSMFSYFYLY